MPRKEPPAGYYSAKQVLEILQITDGMLSYYVKTGKIRRVVPPSRKFGFYVKEDVDRLHQELTSFFGNT